MCVGDKGKLLGGFRSENPQIIPEAGMRAYRNANNLPEPAPRERGGAAARDAIGAQCRLDHGLQGRPGELWRFPACRPDQRRNESGLDLAAAWRPKTTMGFGRCQDHEHGRREQVSDSRISPRLGNYKGHNPMAAISRPDETSENRCRHVPARPGSWPRRRQSSGRIRSACRLEARSVPCVRCSRIFPRSPR